MPVSVRLSRQLQQTLGQDAAEDLVSWMHGVEAQRAELRELNELNFARLDARITTAVSELRQEMHMGFGKLGQEMAQLEARLERRIGDLIKWSFVFWVSAVGAIAALAGVLG